MITFTEKATKAVKRFTRGNGSGAGLRLKVSGGGCSGFQYEMAVENAGGAEDTVIEENGMRVFIDAASAQLLQGVTVDFLDTLTESGFTFTNPNASHTCGCGKSFSV